MGQQLSTEAALAAFRRKYAEAVDENVLLHALVAQLEEQVAELQAGEQQEQQASASHRMGEPV